MKWNSIHREMISILLLMTLFNNALSGGSSKEDRKSTDVNGLDYVMDLVTSPLKALTPDDDSQEKATKESADPEEKKEIVVGKKRSGPTEDVKDDPMKVKGNGGNGKDYGMLGVLAEGLVKERADKDSAAIELTESGEDNGNETMTSQNTTSETGSGPHSVGEQSGNEDSLELKDVEDKDNSKGTLTTKNATTETGPGPEALGEQGGNEDEDSLESKEVPDEDNSNDTLNAQNATTETGNKGGASPKGGNENEIEGEASPSGINNTQVEGVQSSPLGGQPAGFGGQPGQGDLTQREKDLMKFFFNSIIFKSLKGGMKGDLPFDAFARDMLESSPKGKGKRKENGLIKFALDKMISRMKETAGKDKAGEIDFEKLSKKLAKNELGRSGDAREVSLVKLAVKKLLSALADGVVEKSEKRKRKKKVLERIKKIPKKALEHIKDIAKDNRPKKKIKKAKKKKPKKGLKP